MPSQHRPSRTRVPAVRRPGARVLVALLSLSLPPLLAAASPAAAQDFPFEAVPWLSGMQRATQALAVGDVDGDGDLDLVCGNYTQSTTLYLNEGEGLAYTPAWQAADPLEATRAVALGDVDGDGDLDLVCANIRQENTLYWNDGGALRTTPGWRSTGASADTRSLALGDVDGDGDLDVVFGNVDAPSTLHLNEGGGFAVAPSWSSPPGIDTRAVALGDVDGDGDLDLVCGNVGAPDALYLNEGGMLATEPAWLSADTLATRGVALGDVDGDGLLDLACANEDRSNTVHLNRGGSFSALPDWVSDEADDSRSVALGDVDGDGDLDLVSAGYYQGDTLHLNDGGSLATAAAWRSTRQDPSQAVVLFDVDGDGDLDAAFGNDFDTRNTLYRNLGGPLPAAAAWRSDLAEATRAVALADVDGDGDLDLFCGNYFQENRLYLNESGVLATLPGWTSDDLRTTQAAAFGDLDGDGDPDLVCGNTNAPLTVHANQGGVLSGSPTWTSAAGDLATQAVALGDVDGDGDPDLAVGQYQGAVLLFENLGGQLSGDPVWSSAATDLDVRGLAWGDLDGDGDPDLVCGNRDRANVMFRNEGGLLDPEPAWSSTGAANATTAVALGDLDGDGDLDLVCGNLAQPNTAYLNAGGVLPVAPDWRSALENDTQAVALVDLDGDGDLDLACGNRGQADAIYLNEGGRLADQPRWSSLEVVDTRALAWGDLDGDGDFDLVAGSALAATLARTNPANPAFRGDPLAPVAQLPNNSAFLRDLVLVPAGLNRWTVAFTAVDLESDPVRVLPEWQLAGGGAWQPLTLPEGTGSALGPLATSPAGLRHELTWDATLLPFSDREVILRLRAVSHPARGGLVQRIPAYLHDAGRIVPRRPEIVLGAAELRFPVVTVGDTVAVALPVANRGNEPLRLIGILLPPQIRLDGPLPPTVAPGGSDTLAILLEPRLELAPPLIRIVCDDPLRPEVTLPVVTDIRPLAFEVNALVEGGTARLGEAVTVQILPAAGVRIERGRLRFRSSLAEAPADTFRGVAISPLGGAFIGVIPGESVSEGGLDYYVEVENSGIVATDPPDAPAASVHRLPVSAPATIATSVLPVDVAQGQVVSVNVTLPQGAVFRQGTLHYRRGGETAYREVALRREGDLLAAPIPAESVGPRGLEYWVGVETSTSRLTDPPVADPGAGPRIQTVLVRDLTETADFAAGRYRLVSLPLDFGPDAHFDWQDLLASQAAFGPYDPVRWRAFRYDPAATAYVEFGAEAAGQLFDLRPGRACWLICSEPARLTSGPVEGRSTATGAPYGIALQPGWNQVGNPFCFPVARDSLLVDGLPWAQADTLVDGPYGWRAGIGYDLDVTVLQPFAGYWFRNDDPEAVRWLAVPAVEAPARAAAGQEAPGGAPAGQGGAAARRPAAKASGGSDWSLRIEALTATAADAGNVVGVRSDAADWWDRHDAAEPPPRPGRALSLYLPHRSWRHRPGLYTSDLRRPSAGATGGAAGPDGSGDPAWGWAFAFDVAKTYAEEGADEVTLRCRDLDRVPADAALRLVDRMLRRTVDLRSEPEYRFHLGRREPVTADDATRFLLLVGSEGFVQAATPGPPRATALRPAAPNPFNPSTLIRFEVARPCRATLRVYDLRGALVRTLYEGPAEPGGHERAWTGEDDRGRHLPSGTYLYRLVTDDGFQATRKLTLVR